MIPHDEFNGFQILYNEALELWEVPELGLSHAKLGKLKNLMQNADASNRRLRCPVDVLVLNRWGNGHEVQKATIIADANSVWVRHSHDEKRRELKSIEHIAEYNDLARRTLYEANQLREQATAMREQADKLIAKLPRITIERLKQLADEAADAGQS